jgi:hypothetical protein
MDMARQTPLLQFLPSMQELPEPISQTGVRGAYVWPDTLRSGPSPEKEPVRQKVAQSNAPRESALIYREDRDL